MSVSSCCKNVIKLVFGVRFALLSPHFSHDSSISPPVLNNFFCYHERSIRSLNLLRPCTHYFCHFWKLISRIKNTTLMMNYHQMQWKVKDFKVSCIPPIFRLCFGKNPHKLCYFSMKGNLGKTSPKYCKNNWSCLHSWQWYEKDKIILLVFYLKIKHLYWLHILGNK